MISWIIFITFKMLYYNTQLCHVSLSRLNTTCSIWRCFLCLSTLFSCCQLLRWFGFHFIVPFYGGGPGRSKLTYKTILSLIQSFNGWRCSDNPFIFSQNHKDLEDLPTTFTSSSVLIDKSSFKSASFFGTSARLLSFFAYRFYSSSTLHFHACMDCKNGVIL